MHNSMHNMGLPSMSLCLLGQAARPLLMLVTGSCMVLDRHAWQTECQAAQSNSLRIPCKIQLYQHHIQIQGMAGEGWLRVLLHNLL